MKRLFLLPLLCFAFFSAARAQAPDGWRLVWADEFDGTKFDTAKWNVIDKGEPHWKRYMAPSLQRQLIKVRKGNLELVGKQLRDGTYVTGGLDSRGKFNFTYGRVDIRAKLGCARGAWPALWAVGDVPNRRWPDDGEIDIMEHLNFDDFAYQTVHSAWTQTHKMKQTPPQGGKGAIDRDGYNVYSLVRTADKISWLINGVETFSYSKLDTEQAKEKGQWPFDHAFYLIFSQQLGGKGTWVGEIEDGDLPVVMWVDYVRFYEQK